MKSRDLNLLLALDALLTEESVTGAARRMHLSTPAMSHTLARIREALGDPILVRGGRRLVPTARALELRGPVKKMVGEVVALLTPGNGADLAEVEREFVVRAPEGISIVFGSVVARALQERMPLASVRFLAEGSGEMSALREGRVDLDIGPAPDRGPEIEIDPLFEQRLTGVVREGHRLLDGPLTLKRFAAERHVNIALPSQSAKALDAALSRAGIRRRIQLTVSSPYAALMATARSDLVATVPTRLAQSVQSSLRLATFKLPIAVAAERIVLSWHPRFTGDAGHAWLRSYLKDVLTSKIWAAPEPR